MSSYDGLDGHHFDPFRRVRRWDWMDRLMVSLIVLCFVGVAWITFAMVRYEWFAHTHRCVRSGEYWGDGYYVGVVGKGGYYHPAGWRWVCYQWEPDDPAPSSPFPIDSNRTEPSR